MTTLATGRLSTDPGAQEWTTLAQRPSTPDDLDKARQYLLRTGNADILEILGIADD